VDIPTRPEQLTGLHGKAAWLNSAMTAPITNRMTGVIRGKDRS
jgi:hypothetical protein